MSAQSHLAQYNVSIESARQFILSNLDNPAYIVEICARFGVTNSMLAEIYGKGVTAETVMTFFASQGIDSTPLDTEQTPEWLSRFLGSPEHGGSDGYHDGYLHGFVERIYTEWEMETGYIQEEHPISFPYQPDESQGATYLQAYDIHFSEGYQHAFSGADYDAIYLDETPSFSPATLLTTESLDVLGTSDGYRNGFFYGLSAVIQQEESSAFQAQYYDAELNNAEYISHYDAAFKEGLEDGFSLNTYSESIYSLNQLGADVLGLFN